LADSLKDQLLKAGFKETSSNKSAKRKPKSKNRNAAKRSKKPANKPANKASPGATSAEDAAAIAERKKIKAQIKELIEAEELKDYKGEIAFGYVLGNKIRQLFVNSETHKRLSGGEVVITRLNGNTRIVPSTLVPKIVELNPGWAVVDNQSDDKGSPDDDEYGDFQVPDDLTW